MKTVYIIVNTLLIVTLQSVHGISDYYLDEHCGGAMPSFRQARLQLTRDYPTQSGPYHPQTTGVYQPDEDCQFRLIARHGYHLMVFFTVLDIPSQDNCTSDWLEIVDGNSTSNLSLTDGKKCGNVFPKDVFTTEGRELTVTFHSNQSIIDSRFELIITEYHTGNCSVSEHMCRNGRCVSNLITGCGGGNGNNPCGDWSDCDTITLKTYYLDEHCNETLYVNGNTGPLLLNLTRHAYYKPNMKCEVTLTAVDLSGQGSSSVDHSRLMVYLSSIDIENQGQCKYDWVEVDDGSSRTTADFSSGKLCGNTAPTNTYRSLGKSMTVYFQSDGSDQFSGFKMVVTPFHTGTCLSDEHQCADDRCISSEATCLGYNTCGDGSDCPLPQPPASITSVYLDARCYSNERLPIHGQIRLQLTRSATYSPHLSCYQTFEAGLGQRMMVYFRSLNIENQGTCSYDWVELDNGASRSSGYINGNKICGSTAPVGVYQTSGRYLTVYFHSDGSDQFSGFDMIITSYHTGSCNSDESQCANSRCIPSSIKCSIYNPCGDYTDFPNCGGSSFTAQPAPSNTVYYMDTHCGSTISNIDSLEQFHLKLTHSPTYRTGMRCQVTIETSPGSHIYFKFVSLDLEQNSDCSFDYVQFFDGDSKYSQNIAGGRHCESTPPSGYFTTSGSYLTVYFHSDNSNQKSGFDLLIQPSDTVIMNHHCGETIDISAVSQIRLRLTNNPQYAAYIQCQLNLETSYDKMMMFYFRDLDMENACSNDWLEIDDGSTRSYPYLAGGKLCGHTIPTQVYSTTGRYITLYFKSDVSVQGRGFDMIITSYRDDVYCGLGEHSCANDRCINASLVCDGYNSCGDYSDCTTRTCKSDEYQCDNGRCIPNNVRCLGDTSNSPCGDYSEKCQTTTTSTTTTTDYFYDYYNGLSGAAIAGITLGTTTFFVLLFVAACFGARRRAAPVVRRVPNVGTVSTLSYAYENPVPIYYGNDAPPPYPGTTGTTGYPGTTALYPTPGGVAVSGTVGTIPTISCGTTATNQVANATSFALQPK